MQTQQRAAVPTLLALLLGFGLMQMGNTLQGTLLSVRGSIESFTPAQIGAIGAGFWVGIVIGSLRCGNLIRSVGHIRAFVALGAIASTAPLLHLLVMDPTAWVAARALTGFCFAGLFIRKIREPEYFSRDKRVEIFLNYRPQMELNEASQKFCQIIRKVTRLAANLGGQRWRQREREGHP